MQLSVDSQTKAAIGDLMETHQYKAGQDDMREQIIAFIYTRYVYNRTFFGKDSQVAMEIRRIIEDLREDQAIEQEKQNSIETTSE